MDGFELARGLQVVLGIGLVIFVHELGHYLAARACKVRVEIFSLGFGPKLIGARIGETFYQVALVPLGGFCRMAGEERRLDGLPPQPDELFAKGVGARFFIYSGGVLMNVLFGLVVFPILFQIGVPFTSPIVGELKPGGPAWRARLHEGDEIVAVNGSRVLEFEHVYTQVALGDPKHVSLVLRDPHTHAEKTYELTPERDEIEGIATIGLRPALARDEHGHVILDVRPGSPAERAGLASGERMVEVVGAVPGLSPWTQLDLAMRGDRPLRLRVEGEHGEREIEIAPELTAHPQDKRVGIAPVVNLVRAVRESPLTSSLGLAPEDRLLAVNDQPILGTGDLQRALLSSQEPVRLRVRRGAQELELIGPALDTSAALALADDLALGMDDDSTVIAVQPDEAAARAGLLDLDEVLEIDGTEVAHWEDVRTLVQRAAESQRAADFRIRRPGASDHLTIAVRPMERPEADYGLNPRGAEYVYRAENLGAAVLFGARYSWRFLEDSWLTLKRMLTRDVSPKNVGGIITISRVSYSLTEAGWIKFFFFLCLVSINLAFLNVLPIPVLDGGHLFFLIIEKIKGSPVSNRVLGTSQAVGVVLLLSLMVYVTYNDIERWFLRP